MVKRENKIKKEKYKCGYCKAEVKKGAKNCHECGKEFGKESAKLDAIKPHTVVSKNRGKVPTLDEIYQKGKVLRSILKIIAYIWLAAIGIWIGHAASNGMSLISIFLIVLIILAIEVIFFYIYKHYSPEGKVRHYALEIAIASFGFLFGFILGPKLTNIIQTTPVFPLLFMTALILLGIQALIWLREEVIFKIDDAPSKTTGIIMGIGYTLLGIFFIWGSFIYERKYLYPGIPSLIFFIMGLFMTYYSLLLIFKKKE
ncbi:MAG: hypothetical protein Q8O89_01550 [Nanoarchaeota archaeon]|nr:hypothetical protein [Nanoarchaeota archaeon]